MKVLITGGSGLLGKSLLETAPKETNLSLTYNKNWQNHTANCVWYHLDIRSRADVFELFEIARPDVVIHCASIGSVDYTETHYTETREVNVSGLSNVVDACNGYRSQLVYISSNAVFGGDDPPYNEQSSLEPVNAYGILKREAERLVTGNADHWLVIRPFMLYGWPYQGARTNWAKHIVSMAKVGKEMKLVDDIVWMPTYAPDCARAIWKLVERRLDKEMLNIAAPDETTLYGFGLEVCNAFGLNKDLIKPVSSDYFSGGQVKARRPKNTAYDLVKLTKLGIVLSGIKRGLEKMREANEL